MTERHRKTDRQTVRHFERERERDFDERRQKRGRE
jgi:hypothetical protein